MMTRGDTERITISIIDENTGEPYVPLEGDSLRFAMKKRYSDDEIILRKEIPIETMVLVLRPEDTQHLDMGQSAGRYKYDIQLTKANGDVHTIIPRGEIVLLEEIE